MKPNHFVQHCSVFSLIVMFFLLVLGNSQKLSAQNPCNYDLGYVETPPPIDGRSECNNLPMNFVVGSGTVNGATATAAFPNISGLSNVRILVIGSFTINKDFTFTNCSVYFDQASSMITAGTVKLVGIDTYFGPCGEHTWLGITTAASGAIQLERCIIYGAENGITFKKNYRNNSSFLIANSFSRNGIGILSTDSGTILKFTAFHKNHFSGAGTLPGSSQKPRAGMRLSKGIAYIGTIVTYNPDDEIENYDFWVNEFRNFLYGIEANQQYLSLKNCRFIQIRPEADAAGEPTGCGINIVNNSQIITGADLFGPTPIGYCEFDRCALAGIYASNTITAIRYAKFIGTQLFGVTSTETMTRTQKVSNCHAILHYPTNKCAFKIERPGNITPNTASITTLINYDTIIIDNPGTSAKLSGIELKCPNAALNKARIHDNTITSAGAVDISYGIIVYGNQTNNIFIEHNKLDAGSSGSIRNFGIFLTDFEGTGHVVYDNKSEGFHTCNFHTQKALNVQYCDNTSNNGGNGFHFMGDNLGTTWSVNDIGAHGEGLLIDNLNGSNGKIGPQTRKGNMWEANDNLYNAHAANCTSVPDFSRFFVEINNNTALLPTKVAPSNWFFYQQGPTEYCGAGYTLSPFYNQYIAGTLPNGYLSAAESWEVKRQLLGYLLQNPATLNSNPAYQNYYNQNQNTTAGKFAQVEALAKTQSYLPAAQQTQYENWVTQRDQLIDDIQTLYSTSNPITLPSGGFSGVNDPILDGKLQNLDLVLSNIEGIYSNALPGWTTQQQSLLTQIQNIPVSQYYEQAWKTLKSWEIQRIQGGTSPSGIYAVAMSDPGIFGAAVRHAFHYMNESTRYSSIAAEEYISLQYRSENIQDETAQELSINLNLQPNPATSTLLIRSEQGVQYDNWTLVNNLGMTIQTGVWPNESGQLQLDVSALPNGLYFFSLQQHTGRPLTAKVVVKH